jgi:hypothetical protein
VKNDPENNLVLSRPFGTFAEGLETMVAHDPTDGESIQQYLVKPDPVNPVPGSSGRKCRAHFLMSLIKPAGKSGPLVYPAQHGGHIGGRINQVLLYKGEYPQNC